MAVTSAHARDNDPEAHTKHYSWAKRVKNRYRTAVAEFHSRRFYRKYYKLRHRTWPNTYWLGVKCAKAPFDLWIYQEMISELRPDAIIESGDVRELLEIGGGCNLIGE